MQLFQLAREQFKYLKQLAPRLKEKGGSTLLEDVDLPLLQFGTDGKPMELEPGESREFKGIELLVGAPPDGMPDYPAITKGINEFVAMSLLFALNPLQRDDEPSLPPVRLMSDKEQTDRLYLRFHVLDTENLGAAAVEHELGKLEELMFSGWNEVPGMQAPFLRKRFVNDEECARAEYLLDALGRAAGYTSEEIETQFDVSPNDRTLTVHEDFMQQMAKVEQTTEARFGRRRH